jgi:hypothetical protein
VVAVAEVATSATVEVAAAAHQKMTATEKEVFKRKVAEYDEADADDGETPPPTPTGYSIIPTHFNCATPASIASGRRCYKCNNFASSKNGTGVRHRGRIAPNRVTLREPTVC